MAEPIIKVENLSKHFIISHEQKESYTSLRDTILRGSKKALSFATSSKNKYKTRTKEEFWALKEVSFDIMQGDKVGIVGRNGAGKSTLLKILSRITEPTSGTITIRGKVASLLEVGTGFHPELTGRENIFLNGAILGMNRTEIRRKFDEIVAFAEVEKFLDTPVKRYSSGMYVRLAFSVAAHLEPEILIVDEVLAVGDYQFQKKCLGKMEDVSKTGRTVLFVSHNMDAIGNLCNVGLLLDNGQLLCKDDISIIVNKYRQELPNNISSKWESGSFRNNEYPSIVKANFLLEGVQPFLKLKVFFSIYSPGFFKDAFVAFDLHNSAGLTIMQAIPSVRPFLKFEPDSICDYIAEIDFVGLIPDIYSMSIWIGSHNTVTYDWQKNILSFEVVQSPSEGRTYPHNTGSGYSVPISRMINSNKV